MRRVRFAGISVVFAVLILAPPAYAEPVNYSVETSVLDTLGRNWGGAEVINNSGQVAGRLWWGADNGSLFFWSADAGTIDVPLEDSSAEWVYVTSLSEAGQVAANLYAGIVAPNGYGLFRPFVWDRTAGLSMLPIPPGASSGTAEKGNALGQVAGSILVNDYRRSDNHHPVVWTSGGMIDIAVAAGKYAGMASDINDAGQVVGDVTDSQFGDGRAFRWSADKGLEDLGMLPGSLGSYAGFINKSGQVAGGSYDSGPGLYSWNRGTIWMGHGRMVDVGTLGGEDSYIMAFNDRGQAAGWSTVASDDGYWQSHAFFWSEADGMIDLGTLGGRNSWANAMNNLGHVVGQSDTADGKFRAFFWSKATGMIDLGSLGGLYSDAQAINDLGQAAGWADIPAGGSRPLIWTITVSALPGDIEWIIGRVRGLNAEGVLKAGQGNALIAKLEAAIRHRDAGKANAACNELRAFINQVRAFVRGGTFSAGQGQPLVDAAQAAIAASDG